MYYIRTIDCKENLKQNIMTTSKTFIITTLIILLDLTSIIAKDMPAYMGAPLPPSEGPIPGIAVLVATGLYYGYKKLK